MHHPGRALLVVGAAGLIAAGGRVFARTAAARPVPPPAAPMPRSSTSTAWPATTTDKKKGGLALDAIASQDDVARIRRSGRRSSASCARGRCRRSASRGRTRRPTTRSSRRSRRRSTAPRRRSPNPGRTDDVPAAQPHRVPERHPRPAGARHRRRVAAAGRRIQPRLRQRHGRRPLADAARSLHLGGAEDQPAGGRRAGPVARRRHVPRPRRISRRRSTSKGCRSARAAARSIPYTFPQDGEYDIQVRLTRDRNEQVEGLTRAARAGSAARPRARAVVHREAAARRRPEHRRTSTRT